MRFPCDIRVDWTTGEHRQSPALTASRGAQESRLSHSYTIYRNNPGDFLGEAFYDWRGHAFQEFARYLRSQRMDVKLEDRESFEVFLGSSHKTEIVVRDSLAIMQNDQAGEYYVLDCHDLVKTADLELMVRDSRCKRILKCQYRATVFSEPVYEKVRPWIYFDRFWPKNEQRIVSSRETPRTSNSLYFRGADWGDRGLILEELSKRRIINPDFKIIDYDDYFRESTAHRVMLSLPGYADICNRDVECFGSGTCVLRPRLRNQFHNELIPDYHYISVDTKCRNADPVEIADKIERRFREIADDHAFIEFVASNAARWFDENVRTEAAMKLTAELLGCRHLIA
jgi:hypothetical protein